MSSIFDSITVPGASLDVPGPSLTPPSPAGGGGAGLSPPPAPASPVSPAAPTAPAVPSAGRWASPQQPLLQTSPGPGASFAPSVPTAPAMPAAAGPTGLVASMEPSEFAKLVREAGSGTVLRTTVPVSQPRRAGSGPPGVSRRYVFPHEGIVYVTLSHSPLDLGTGVRVVDCLAVAYEGKPLGGANPVL